MFFAKGSFRRFCCYVSVLLRDMLGAVLHGVSFLNEGKVYGTVVFA